MLLRRNPFGDGPPSCAGRWSVQVIRPHAGAWEREAIRLHPPSVVSLLIAPNVSPQFDFLDTLLVRIGQDMVIDLGDIEQKCLLPEPLGHFSTDDP
jgi:hypothetical protein